MTKKLIYLFFLGSIFLSSCETEIDTIAKYKDITVVYGLLNPNETDHYIRITKAFSGEGNANDMANDANNIYYADGEISVTIDEYDASGVFKKSFSLNRTVNEIPKDDGVFDNSQNVLYKFVESNLKQDYTYKLKIVNHELGKEITSETTIANNTTLANPNQFDKGSIKLANISGTPLTHSFTIKTGSNSGRVKVNFVFNYFEHYTDTNIAPKLMKVKISLGEQKTTSNEGGEVLVYTLEGGNLFSALQNNITANVANLKSRNISNATLEIISAGTDLSTYISVNEPSTTINQTKPEFTNLTNALGVFSSRNTTLIYPQSFLTQTTPEPESLYGFYDDGRVNYDNDTMKKLLALGLDFCDPLNVSVYAPRCTDVISNWNTFNP